MATIRFETIKPEHVGQPTVRLFGKEWIVSNFMGRIMPKDIGKRVYLVPQDDPDTSPILQVENDAQRDARLCGRRPGR